MVSFRSQVLDPNQRLLGVDTFEVQAVVARNVQLAVDDADDILLQLERTLLGELRDPGFEAEGFDLERAGHGDQSPWVIGVRKPVDVVRGERELSIDTERVRDDRTDESAEIREDEWGPAMMAATTIFRVHNGSREMLEVNYGQWITPYALASAQTSSLRIVYYYYIDMSIFRN